jgi:alkylhydroperoxidase family enzyme
VYTLAEKEDTMARISLDPPRTLLVRAVETYSRRRYGTVLQPALAYAHNPKILSSYLRFEQRVARWKALDDGLKHVAVMVSAARIGCAWCMDFGYWEAHRLGLPADLVRKVPAWRDHREAFSERQLLVMEYAEAVTATPPAVTDELAATLRKELGEKAFVELTVMVAVENLRSRVNSAFGLTGQGFSDRCEIGATS